MPRKAAPPAIPAPEFRIGQVVKIRIESGEVSAEIRVTWGAKGIVRIGAATGGRRDTRESRVVELSEVIP